MKRAAVLAVCLSLTVPAWAADQRQLVEMPGLMQEHMLANMRDHVAALDDIFAALAADDVVRAADVAEGRIGMSSLASHGAEHMAPFMPETMRQIGTTMHRAASRFAVTARNAEVEHTYDSAMTMFAALHEVTAACRACHDAYRIR